MFVTAPVYQAATVAVRLACVCWRRLAETALSATPLHSFEGITLPLSVLAVQGAQLLGFGRLRHKRAIGVIANG